MGTGPAPAHSGAHHFPYAKRHYVDHTQYDTTSILKFITRRFAPGPLPGVRPQMGDLTAALDLLQ